MYNNGWEATMAPYVHMARKASAPSLYSYSRWPERLPPIRNLSHLDTDRQFIPPGNAVPYLSLAAGQWREKSRSTRFVWAWREIFS